MNISFLNDGNLAELYNLVYRCGESEKELRLTLDSTNEVKIVGLFDSSKLVGYGVIEIINRVNDSTTTLAKFGVSDDYLKDSALLVGCLIDPKYRGNKLQIDLVSEREKYAKENNCISMLVSVSEKSIASTKNIRNFGYSVIGSRVRKDGELINLMYKELK